MNKIIAALALTNLFSANAFASDKYCSSEGKDISLHIFGSSFTSEVHKRQFIRGMDNVNDSLLIGDSLKVLLHRPNGDYKVTLEGCVPGCPETSLLGSLTAECSAQVAKKDRATFNAKLVSSIRSAAASDTNEYNVFSDLMALSDYYRGRTTSSNSEVYVFHSLAPSDLENNSSQASYDAAFVELVQNQKALPSELPDLVFVNSDTSKLNYEFWADIQQLVAEGQMSFTTLD